MAEPDFRVIMELVNTIINPVNTSMAKHGEAMTSMLAAVQRIAELVQAEPTRRTILEEIREDLARLGEEYAASLKEHDRMCERRGGEWNAEDVRRAGEIVRTAEDVLKTHLGKHCEHTDGKLKPVDEMKQRFDHLILTIRIAVGLGLGMFTYLAWALQHVPAPGKP